METKKFALIPLALIVTAMLATLPTPVHAGNGPAIYITPSTNVFYSDTTPLNSKFNITVWVANITESQPAFVWQIYLKFNKNQLKALRVGYSPGPSTSEFFSGHPTVPVAPVIDNDLGYVQHGESLLGADNATTGPGVSKRLMWVEFEIILSPPMGGSLSSVLNINNSDSWIEDTDLNEISIEKIDATYQYNWRGILPKLKVEPEQYIAPVSYVNETFSVDITISNLEESSRMVGLEFKLGYNTTLLEVVDVREGSFMNDSRWHNAQPPNPYTYFINYVEFDYVLVGILLIPNNTGQWSLFPYGNGVLATITFKEIFQPISPEPSASCELRLYDTMLVDDDLNEIPHEAESGYYEVEALSLPTLTVTPSTYEGTHRGEIFSINININNLDARWRLVGPEFKLRYDTNILKVVDVREGSFMNDSRWHNAQPPNPYTYFINYVEFDYVLVGILLIPNNTGQWNLFPYGNGVLATIDFQIIQGPPASCDLTLFDILLVDAELNEIPYSEPQHGSYSMTKETLTHTIVWDSQTFYVVTESDITINSGFPVQPPDFDQAHRMLSFTVTVPVSQGYCKVTIPKALLNAGPYNNWAVLVDGELTPFIVEDSGANTVLIFNVTSGAQYVNIIGTDAVPEFPVVGILAIILIAGLVVAASVKTLTWRKRWGTKIVRYR